ncbi:activating signal cointegrator 1 complex subunit 1 [Hylaeus volcanicus]|uniref:activating signal cointegrator 1 complex subunit 1 n=1 Tax=Hylaeus volcanicus TaxID=313075 RepID=UPI0023B80155|nr:activating signal cointegrator 1 complex subunit 1 [Hylaeus volcanicus]
MSVLKPELVWVDGRCYRFLEQRDAATCNTPYVENDDLKYQDCEEEFATDIEIVPYETAKFKHVFHVAKSFFPFIIGAKHQVRKRLQNETKTTIQIPGPGQDGDIKIIGYDHKGIITARHRINLIIESTRGRLNFTHFLSIPLNEDQIIMKFNTFKHDVMTFENTPRGVDEMLFQQPKKLHLTLGVLTLLDDIERDQAIKALDYCKDHIIKAKIKKHGQIHIRLQGTDIMNDDPSEVNVLYARIIDTNNILQDIADEIVNHYANIGLLRKEKDRVKLHVTLMNTSFKLDDKEFTDKRKLRFDAREILKVHGNTIFGETTLKELHISQRHTISSNGYYQATATINLAKDL